MRHMATRNSNQWTTQGGWLKGRDTQGMIIHLEQVGIFTSEGCQFFPLSACKEALNIMSKCPSTFYGLVKGGVYVYAPHGHSK